MEYGLLTDKNGIPLGIMCFLAADLKDAQAAHPEQL